MPEVHSARLESSLFKSLKLENNLTHTHKRAHRRAHSQAGGKVTAGHGGTRILPTPGKLAERSGEGEQRRAMLLTWQPSHHTKRVMSTDSAEICGILRRLHLLFISVHIIRTEARCNIITTKTYIYIILCISFFC